MRILFAGSPAIAVPSLLSLSKNFEIIGVLTNPDKKKGRGENGSTEVKEKAVELGIKVYQPEKLNSSFLLELKNQKPDIMVCFAYGKIFRKSFLDLFPQGSLNIHPSLLPKYRGPSPIQAAILNRDEKTGISIQEMSLEMDRGDIINSIEIPISSFENSITLSEKAGALSADLILDTLKNFEKYRISKKKQNEKDATYCKLIQKEDGLINWNMHTALEIEAKIRAFIPWPRSFTFLNNRKLYIEASSIYTGTAFKQESIPGKVLGVDKAEGILIQTCNGLLCVKQLQLEAKKQMDFKSFLNGNQTILGSILGEKL